MGGTATRLRNQYIDGEVYAMSGGSVNHGRIVIRLTGLFDTYLADSTCITGNSGIKLNIIEANSYTYPDASVTCDDRDKTTTQYITYEPAESTTGMFSGNSN